MCRTGNCWDNAVAESFFATLKAEVVEYERYPTRAAAVASIRSYIDNFYNLKRRRSQLAYMSPIEFELKTYVTALARPRPRGRLYRNPPPGPRRRPGETSKESKT
ncbi:IS3 family transposase [Sorangium sp. So ce341]|uniref:IS3 family transposase n=1 Tax=Sorangium sp. So ce341 TaxID=3133302 RepID=UPI003F621318